ncbi:unnamed protein product [Haemonchus placei]|uniref:Uncharacterized protein n=1 Tax=Haemonchus placei TaxID=6290 RepID=A0A3P8B4E3_HAEPC|nr:unnamed protein product [Haemonchus placei]
MANRRLPVHLQDLLPVQRFHQQQPNRCDGTHRNHSIPLYQALHALQAEPYDGLLCRLPPQRMTRKMECQLIRDFSRNCHGRPLKVPQHDVVKLNAFQRKD